MPLIIKKNQVYPALVVEILPLFMNVNSVLYQSEWSNLTFISFYFGCCIIPYIAKVIFNIFILSTITVSKFTVFRVNIFLQLPFTRVLPLITQSHSQLVTYWSRTVLASLFDVQDTPLASLFDVKGPPLFSVVCLNLMVCMHVIEIKIIVNVNRNNFI